MIGLGADKITQPPREREFAPTASMGRHRMSTLPRFRIQKTDGLYLPIPFLFVTERMCAEILAEREALAEKLPEATRKRQALFARYDPRVCAEAFGGLLNLFGNPAD